MSFPLDPAVLLGAAAELVVTPPVVDDAEAAVEDTTAVPLATADEEDVEFDELAPVAAIRCSRSAWVVQARLVPSELTRGRAAQLWQDQFQSFARRQWSTYIKPEPHDWSTYLPSTHCAKESCTQASVPDSQDELAVRVANCALHRCQTLGHSVIQFHGTHFCSMAFWPFWRAKPLSRGKRRGSAKAAVARVSAKVEENFMTVRSTKSMLSELRRMNVQASERGQSDSREQRHQVRARAEATSTADVSKSR